MAKGVGYRDEGLELCEAWILTRDFEARVLLEWSWRKIIMVAWIVDGAGGVPDG